MRKQCLALNALLIGLVALGGSVVVADEQEVYDYREQHGPANVVWMDGLLDDYNDDKLTETDLMRELWAEQPELMNVLFAHYGQFALCFQVDLIMAQSNGVKSEDNGVRVFFDNSVYLNGTGNVIPGYESAYNNAVRANAILNDTVNQNPTCACPMNNQCCRELTTGGTDCQPATGKRCCNTGPNELNCLQSQGNPCS